MSQGDAAGEMHEAQARVEVVGRGIAGDDIEQNVLRVVLARQKYCGLYEGAGDAAPTAFRQHGNIGNDPIVGRAIPTDIDQANRLPVLLPDAAMQDIARRRRDFHHEGEEWPESSGGCDQSEDPLYLIRLQAPVWVLRILERRWKKLGHEREVRRQAERAQRPGRHTSLCVAERDPITYEPFGIRMRPSTVVPALGCSRSCAATPLR